MRRILFLIVILTLLSGCTNTPANFKVENASTTSIKLNWEKSKWASGYKIYRSESEDGNFKEISTTQNISYEDMGLKSGVSYFYKISAIGFGNTKESQLSEKIDVATELLVPSNLKVSASNSKVFLDWYSVKDATGYKIYRSESEKGEYVQIGESKSNSYEDKNLESGKNYYYRVKAFKGKSESAFSYIVYVKSGMGSPRNINVTPNGVNGIVVTWDRVEGADNYYIYRSRNENATFDEIGFTDATRYEDRNLISGRIYYYKVKASGKGTESAVSESSYAMTKVAPPKNINLRQVTQETVSFEWGSVDLVDGYKIYRSDKVNTNYKELDYTTETSFVDKGLDPNSTYYYKITAYVGKTESDYSDEKKVETNQQVIALKIIRSGMTDIKIGWTKISGVSRYVVYRSEKSNDDYEEVGKTSDISFDDKDLSPYKDYYYRVKGLKDNIEINSTILVVKSINEDKKETKDNKVEGSKNYLINSIAVSSDANIVAAATSENNIKLWKISPGDFLMTLTGHVRDVNCVAFSPDGTILASGDSAGNIKIWGMPDGALLKTIKAHSDKVVSVAVGIDNKTLISGSSDKMVKMWDISTGKEMRSFKGHEKGITKVAIFSDNSRIASASSDKTIKIWNIDSGKIIKTFVDKYVVGGKELENYSVGEVTSLSIDPSGKRIVSGNADNKVKIWDVDSGNIMATMRGHMDVVSDVVFNKIGTKIASVSWDKSIKIWDVSSPKSEKWGESARSEYLNGHSAFITSVATGNDSNMIFSGSKDGTVKMWDINTGRVVRTFSEK